MTGIAKRAAETLALVEKLGERVGRKITVVAATKTRTAEEINEAIAAGITAVGENRPQELRDKAPFIRGAELHLIGPLQPNKIKYVVGKAALIQSVDSVELAREIDMYAKKLGIVQNVLIEVNSGGEESKRGFSLNDAERGFSEMKRLENLRFRGLMTVLPKIETGRAEAACDSAGEIFGRIKRGEEGFDVFSCGMTDDFALAIERGSNMVRLGRAIFGERTAPTPPADNDKNL